MASMPACVDDEEAGRPVTTTMQVTGSLALQSMGSESAGWMHNTTRCVTRDLLPFHAVDGYLTGAFIPQPKLVYSIGDTLNRYSHISLINKRL